MKHIVIVGSGHAGLTLSRELRLLNKDIAITLLSRDSGDMYYKPNLSKAISMKKSPADLVMKRKSVLEQEQNINILSEVKVTGIEKEAKCLFYLDSDGVERELDYDQLVLATGASPVDLKLTNSERCISVNSLSDYEKFREQLEQLDPKEKRIAIIGAGFVGVEFASDLCSNGYGVDVIDAGDWPLNQALPKELGNKVMAAFPSDKAKWHMGCKVSSVEDEGEVLTLNLNNGTSITAGMIISSVGLSPNVELARAAGLEVSRGIVTDEYLRTNYANIYALGDCAETFNIVRPFIGPATQSAKCLAKTLIGEETAVEFIRQAVQVKLSYIPLLICPASEPGGDWNIDGEQINLIARYISASRLNGFSLLGEAVTQKIQLLKEFPLNTA